MTSETPTATTSALRRSSRDRVLLGVCGGLAQTLELRPLLVRIGAVLFGALAFPLLVIAYAAIALIVPRDDGRVLLGGAPDDGREQLLGWSAVLFAGLLLIVSGLRPEQLVWPALDRGGLVLAAFAIVALVIREGRGAAAAPAVPGASAPGAP
ncbi:MAG TPA: PspC domain-containing protein, partial [Conexibacter sp.]|nr:PspC domain-containing protein [Conexibacter sp.]